MPNKVILTVTEGNLKGEKYLFDSRATCLIGRAADCFIKIPSDAHHSTISRYHCLLDINPPQIRVRDLGSLHGTYVNDRLIGQRQADRTAEETANLIFPEYDLQPGDKIKLSHTVFQVAIEVDRPIDTTINLQNQKLIETSLCESSSPIFIKHRTYLAIAGYDILKMIGKGGFSEVYLARDRQTKKLVAIKFMSPKVAANQRAIEMFLREIENTRVLNHPNLVSAWDCHYSDGVFFLVLEYCHGGNVSDLIKLRGGKLSVDEAVSIILQILDGLDYAHNVKILNVKKADGSTGTGWGIVHRDIKPDNIFLSPTSDRIIAKLGDYGLSKSFDLAGLSGQTITGTSAGTPNFMSRQQLIDFKYAQPEVDVWATVASLYYMLTGDYPRDFGTGDPILGVLQGQLVPIRARNPNIPQALADLVDLALVEQPQIHFKNALVFRQALSKTMGQCLDLI